MERQDSRRRGISFLRVSTDNRPRSPSLTQSDSSPNGTVGSVPRSDVSGSFGSPTRVSINGSPRTDLRADPRTDLRHDPVAMYLTQLAARQARVVELRQEQARITAELEAATADLEKFQEGSRHLEGLVGSPRAGHNRSPSSSSQSQQQDVLDMGRRVVDGIGNQVWSFFEEVRKTTLGEVELDPEYPADREGRPRQLRARKSISDFVETVRRRSPQRQRSPQRPLFTASSPTASPSVASTPTASKLPPRGTQRNPERKSFQEKIDNALRSPSLSPERSPNRLRPKSFADSGPRDDRPVLPHQPDLPPPTS